MNEAKKIYFASDFHLGADHVKSDMDRELLIIKWLDQIKADAHKIYLVGDIFDYWFEYKSSVPKGYFRLFSKMHELVVSGIEVHYFKGNHDLWHFGYLETEVGLKVHDGPLISTIDDQSFFIAHGDGLGPGDLKYKFIKSILTNKLCQRMFSVIHPTIGLILMRKMSLVSRNGHDHQTNAVEANALPIQFCEQYLKDNPEISYFIMGHWHHPIVYRLKNQISHYVNLGDWISYFSYAVWDGSSLELKRFKVE